MIGLLTGLISLSIGDGGQQRQIRQEAKRLAELIEIAADEAILTGSELGLYLQKDHYLFLKYQNDQGWNPIEETLLRRRDLKNGVILQLMMEEQPIELPTPTDRETVDRFSEAEEVAGIKPQILLLSSGERTPFEITFRWQQRDRIRLQGGLLGELQMQTVRDNRS